MNKKENSAKNNVKKEKSLFLKNKELSPKLIHVYSMHKLSNGNFIVGGRDITIKIFDPTLTKCLKILKGHINTVFSIAELSQNLLISGSADTTVKVWDKSNLDKIKNVATY